MVLFGNCTASLNKVIEDNFKNVFGEDTKLSDGERQKWLSYAQNLAAQGHDPNYIKQFMLSEMGKSKSGRADTSDSALRSMIDETFRKVLADAPRSPSSREVDAWLKVAQKMRTDGHGAAEIQSMLEGELTGALSNR